MGWFDRRRRGQEPDDSRRSGNPGPREGASPGGPTGPGTPAPLTDQRIVDWLDGHQYHWFRDNDGELGGLWRGRCFYFFRLGPERAVLQVRGHWNRAASIERLPEILEVCNEWAVERIWPKAYTRVDDDGRVSVIGETATDVATGVTDDQLADLLECGLVTTSMFFDELEDRFPDPLARA